MGGTLISFQHLYKIFANPYYKGLIILKSGETYRGAHQPMVSPEEFDEAQRILGRPGRPRPSVHEFTYSGMLTCAGCDCVLTPERHVKPSGKTYTYYRCRARLGKKACKGTIIPESIIEEQALAALRQVAVTPKAGRWITERLRRTMLNEVEQLHAVRASVQQALDDAVREGDTLLGLRLRRQVDEDTFERKRLEILDRQANLRLRLGSPDKSPKEMLLHAEKTLAFATLSARLFERSGEDPVRRRQIVQCVTANWKVEGRKALYSAKEPFSFLAGAESIQRWYTIVEDLRTWALNTTDYCAIPDLEHEGSESRGTAAA